jgi:hypothetical protein
MKLEVKYFGKFAKYTATLGNAAPLSNCTCLRRCIQGHLNYHLSSTSIILTGIDLLDASECIRNPAGKSIMQLSLRELLYKITLENNAPLFLQLSQRPTGEVDAVIPNTAEAEVMAERMNAHIAAWCHFYWNDVNPGAEKFYCKLSERAFNQVLLHEISACTWDPILKAVTSPRGQSEMASTAEFEQLEWVKMLTQGGISKTTKKNTRNDPKVAFNFQDDFSVGTIHGNNASPSNKGTTAEISTNKLVEIQDDDDNDVSVLTTKTTSDAQNKVNVGCRVASGSNPIVGPTAGSTQTETAHGGSPDPAIAGPAGGGARGPGGK